MYNCISVVKGIRESVISHHISIQYPLCRHVHIGGAMGTHVPTMSNVNFNPIDPTHLSSNMRYFPRISPNSLKISPKFRVDSQIQSLPWTYLFIKTKLFLLRLKLHFTSYNMIYWAPTCGRHFWEGFFFGKMWKNMEKRPLFPGSYGRIGKIPHGRLWPDWGLKG